MRLLSCVIAATAWLATSLAQAAVNPPLPPPIGFNRPLIGPLPVPSAQARLRTFTADPAGLTCANGQPRVVEAAPFEPAVATTYLRPPGARPPPSEEAAIAFDYSFSVGANGEILDLQWLKRPDWEAGVYGPTDDLAATLASWRFAVGAPAAGCHLTITRTSSDLASASRVALLKMRALAGRSTPPAVLDALNEGRHCRQGESRRPRRIDYPDTRPFEGRAAARPWAAVGYDIDPAGKLRNVRVEAQEGDPALAKAYAAAVAASRYYAGPEKTGCAVTVSARARITAMPPKPALKSFVRPGDTCDLTEAAMNLPTQNPYPPAYSRRSVEGWAIIRFDVAPWGQIGNIEVAAAQPSAAFGDYAKMLVGGARPKAPAQGYRGCVVPVIYAMPPGAADEEAGPLNTIPPIR